jgi:hypothetical protein
MPNVALVGFLLVDIACELIQAPSPSSENDVDGKLEHARV